MCTANGVYQMTVHLMCYDINAESQPDIVKMTGAAKIDRHWAIMKCFNIVQF